MGSGVVGNRGNLKLKPQAGHHIQIKEEDIHLGIRHHMR